MPATRSDSCAPRRSTPLAEHAFSGVEAQGPMQAKVDLFLPFKDFVHRRVLVHGQLGGRDAESNRLDGHGHRFER